MRGRILAAGVVAALALLVGSSGARAENALKLVLSSAATVPTGITGGGDVMTLQLDKDAETTPVWGHRGYWGGGYRGYWGGGYRGYWGGGYRGYWGGYGGWGGYYPRYYSYGGYYPRYYGGYYPWGWSGIGFGGYYGGYYDPWYYGGYPTYSGSYNDYDAMLRLKMKPREAQVFADGYFMGVVDDFDGMWQRLHLQPGPHRIEVRSEGYETLMFEVNLQPDKTITYTGELKKVIE